MEVVWTFLLSSILSCLSLPLFGLVGCFGFNGPLRQYFSLYRAVSQREGERRERIDESKNVQTTPTRTYCKHNRPLPYYHPNCRTPRHWKLTQHHRTTRPPPLSLGDNPIQTEILPQRAVKPKTNQPSKILLVIFQIHVHLLNTHAPAYNHNTV